MRRVKQTREADASKLPIDGGETRARAVQATLLSLLLFFRRLLLSSPPLPFNCTD